MINFKKFIGNKNDFKHNIFKLQVLVMLIPISIISFFHYDVTKDEMEDQQINLLQVKSEQVSSLLDVYAESLKTYAVLVSQNDQIAAHMNALKNELPWEPEDNNEIRNYPNSEWEDINNGIPNDDIVNLRDYSKQIFAVLNEEHNYIGNIEIFNENAVVIMRGHRDYRGDLKKDEFVTDALSGKNASGYLVSKRTGQPAIDGIAPVVYKDKIIGAIKIGMYITEQVALEIEKQTGIVMFSFDRDVIINVSDYKDNEIVSGSHKNIGEFSFIESTTTNEIVEMRLKSDVYDHYIIKGLAYTNLYNEVDNSNYAITIYPVFDYKSKVIGANMIILNNDVLLAGIHNIRSNHIKNVLFILVLVIVFSIIFSNKIGNPLINFKQQLIYMKTGDRLDYLQDIYGPQELTEMAFEFNSLIDTISTERDKNEKLTVISNLDGLTNLFNHRKFYLDLNYWMSQKKLFSIIFLDLDNFKLINDNLGHSVGDKILRELSNILKSFENMSKLECRAYRYGGEEFAVLIENKDNNEAFELAELIRKQVMHSNKFKMLSGELLVTISAGVSSYPLDSTLETELVDFADYAMYYSKSRGRNQTTIYDKILKKI